MNTYYKAVRPDGADFFTGTVQWLPKTRRLGRPRIVTHPTSTEAVQGDHATSLAVSTDPTRLPGSSWPLRLCEVEPMPGVPVIECDRNKRQAVAWRVVREIEPHVRFGPMGVHVAALIERAGTLTPSEVSDLAAAARDASRDASRAAAGAAAWDAAWDAARDAAARDAARDAAWDVARYAARDAAQDAAIALTIRDLVGQHGFTQQHYDTLTMPWRSVIGRIHPDDAEVTR